MTTPAGAKSSGSRAVVEPARVGAHLRDEPHRAILDVAVRTNADLIVVGNRGLVRRGRFTKATPARVLRGANCSVLVVDTSDAAA